ncbi:MAG TPA: DUF6132 family protein [Ignavibacteriaceae bacterium]|nr:DUF6132 family protein [Ignavibacteriaceae bacterium]
MLKNFKNQSNKNKLIILSKIIIPVFLGAIAGYSYYYYIGCVSGTCPITSNPYISTAYGAVVGSVFISFKKKKDK